MTTAPGATQPADELRAEQALIEQQQEEPSRAAPEIAEAPPQPEPEKPATERRDPRAERLERLSERANEELRGEEERSAEVTVIREAPQSEPEKPEAQPERTLKIKVRGEVREMTESEVIALAQKNDAADSYLEEAKNLLADAKRTVRQPEAEQPTHQPQPEKPNRIAKAIEMLKSGGDPAEAELLLREAIAEQANDVVERTRKAEQAEARLAVIDRDFAAGFEAIGQEFPDIKNEIATDLVISLATKLERADIINFLDTAPEPVKSQFAEAGITAEGVSDYAAQHVHALFRDMHLKGYKLHPPNAIIRAAGKTVAEWKPGNTPPAAPTPTPTPTPPNRSERKVALQQPERASIPRPAPGGRPTPKSEPERASSARAEMRQAHRSAVRR